MSEYWINKTNKKKYTFYYSEGRMSIDESEKKMIISDLYNGLDGYDVFQYFGSQPNIFHDYDHVVVAKDLENKAIGLIGSKWFESSEIKFIYIWTAIVVNEYQKTNLIHEMTMHMLTEAFLKKGFTNFIVTKTYNPTVYKLFFTYSKMFQHAGIYPDILQDIAADSIRNIVDKVAALVFPKLKFDKKTGRVIGGQSVLAPNFFPNLPYCNNIDIYNYFKSNLTPDDQILTILYIPDAEKQTYVTKFLKLQD